MQYKKDILIFFGIFLLALLVRLPFISHPMESIFDEHFQHVTVSNLHRGSPFFDLHPPLATLLWEGAVHQKEFSQIVHGGVKIRVPFDDFPYYNLRFLMAILGSLLPAIVFLIARLFSIEISLATLPAIFIIFDNALIIYSRSILPDMFLLFFGFLGILLWLLSHRSKIKIASSFLFFLAMLSVGSAISIKWTGLGFLGIILLYEAYHTNIKRVVFAVIGVGVVYLLVFAVFFVRLTGNNIESVYKVNALNSVHFTQKKNITNFAQFFVQYHQAMMQANKAYDTNFEMGKHPTASKPYQWLYNQKNINFWVDQNYTAGIVLSGNFPAWIIGILSTLTLATLTLLKKLKYSISVVLPKSIYLLLCGFFISYVPLFFIDRSLFIYHYFPALIFSYMLVPFVLSFWASLLQSTFTIRRIVKIFVIIVVTWYIAFIPRIYGIPSPFSSIQKTVEFDTMAKTQAVVV
ncbi:MAG: phospholipid carrier-dependent glycosyltransferase [Patescibacteria group bacterium]